MASISGFKNLKRNLKRITNSSPKAYRSAMHAITLEVRSESQKIVPVDTGVLRASASSGVIKSGVNGSTGFVSYSTDYAVYVHEDLSAKHNPPTRAKYLEGPMISMRSKALSIFDYYITKDRLV